MKNLLLLIVAVAAFANPSWYGKPSSKSYEIIGYGASVSAKDAEADAIKDIGDQIAEVAVSETKFKGAVMRNAERVLNREAKAQLKGAEILRLEKEGAGFFARARLDRRPIETRFLERIKPAECLKKSDGFLARSPFAQSLNKAAGCAVDFSITKKDDLYFVVAKNASIAWNEVDLTRLFDVSQNPQITIAPSKNELKKGEEFEIAIDANKSGFVTLFGLKESGEFESLSETIDENKTIVFPAKAVIDDDRTLQKIFFIAVFSQAPIERKAPKGTFDELIALLDRHIYSVAEIKTRK
ncbi:MAG: LPP20 family lipoprotein [Helicobacteraceae bacterium]|nr:LPP20 family lipoprotein [Helicobacteraceae bacterium]